MRKPASADRFLQVVRSAIQIANNHSNKIVLIAASPDRAEPEYGWIQRGTRLGWIGGLRLTTVQDFMEKPSPYVAGRIMRTGALWNTLILAAKLDTLWNMGRHVLPELLLAFERHAAVMDSSRDQVVLEDIYGSMPICNFSSDFLRYLPDEIIAMEMNGVLWCDWGKPERIIQTLNQIRRPPLFPLHYAVAV